MAIGATQKWYAGAGVASVAVLAAGWFLLVAPQQTTAGDITAQASTVTTTNQGTEAKIAVLKSEFKTLPELTSQVATIRTHIPESPSEPALLRTLSAIALKSGVKLVSIQAQAPSALAGSAATATGANAFSTPGQVSQIPLTIEVSGTFAHTRLFLNAIEGMQRVMLVTALDITRGSDVTGATSLRTVVTSRVFMANPGGSAAPAAVAPATGTTTTNQAS